MKYGSLVVCTALSLIGARMARAAEPATPAAAGAKVPFVTLEAEAQPTNGTLVRLTMARALAGYVPELEASGRAYVELAKTGDYVDFRNASACNAVVIRHCIPDAPEGGGITATLGLYVNGQRRQTVTLSSRYNWIYNTNDKGAEAADTNLPTPYAHTFWDETRLPIEGGLKAGDTLRLQKDTQDTAAFYRIDLIDLETIPAPLPQPANSLSVADYGAKGQDAATDTAAIQKCIDDAKAQGKIVWMPPGKYLQNAAWKLDGVRVQGAGVWHTCLYDTVGNDAPTWSANCGFRMEGDGSSVSDLYIDSLTTVRRTRKGPKPFLGRGRNWNIENVWITHTNTGVWIGGENGVIRNCRVHFTYADGININGGGPRHILVENNHVRGNGDDGMAILSEAKDSELTSDITLRHNTVEAVRWGCACDLAGGKGHVIEDNLMADSTMGFAINLPGSYPMHPMTGAIIRRNVVLRCGTNLGRQRRGAIWTYAGSTTISGAVIEQNQILQPLFRGIHLAGSQNQQIICRDNLIDAPGEDAIYIDGKVVGSGEWTGNTVRGLSGEHKPFVNNATDAFHITQHGNSWQ